jgi:hypothetical protein
MHSVTLLAQKPQANSRNSSCIISIIRIFTLTQRTKSKDIFWTGIYPAIWSIVEIHCGILCSCLATLRPILRRFIPWLGGTTKDSTSPYELKYIPRTDVKQSSRLPSVSETAAYPPGSDSAEALKEDATGYAVHDPRSEAATGQREVYSGKSQDYSSDEIDETREGRKKTEGKTTQIHVK